MLVPYSWLKDYIDINISPAELADKLTDAGIEVENYYTVSEGIKNIVSGKVISINTHPSSERLFVCVVDTGKAIKTIVTAATNVTADAVVPVALSGSVLAEGKEITSANFQGVVSEGMLCSAQELGVGAELLTAQEREGIFILPEGTPIGEDINKILNLDDTVMELSLTPNRADCLSIINVAREVAADLEIPCHVNKPQFNGGEASTAQSISIDIANSELCSRYIGKVVTDVKVGSSPLWLQNRLRAAGIRPINNIVDVTNYIMLEYGQPMHAFDYDLLSGKRIIVRSAEEGEVITTLDDVRRTLDSETLVIADAEKAVAIAGIMGGADTEVTLTTQNILLESAYFEGSSIRKNSRKLGLRSESSHRFEKGIDLVAAEEAMNRAAQLIEEMAAGKPAKDSVDVFPSGYKPVEVAISLEQVNSLLGTNLSDKIVENTFSRLQFTWEKQGSNYLVQIPSYRRDITRMVDLVEEVARLYGYNNIPTTLPIGQTTQVQKTQKQIVEEIIIETLTACGLNEVITYSFINPQWLDKLNIPENDILRNTIEVQNPLNEDQKIMRTTIIPGLMETVQRNFSRRNTVISFFEMGRVFLPPMNPLPEEKSHLVIFMGGTPEGNWKNKQNAYDFYDVKGVVEELLNRLNINAKFNSSQEIAFCHPGRTAKIYLNDIACGYIGEVHPEVSERYDFSCKGYVCELDVDMLISAVNLDIIYKPLPKYPAVTRDLALLVPVDVTADIISQTIAENGGELLQKFSLFDVYSGEQITTGYKSMAYSLTYQSNIKTLTDEEIAEIQERILVALKKLNIALR